MKINLICIFITINWALILANSVAVPPKDEKPIKEEAPALPHDSDSVPISPDRLNVDLSKTTTPEKEAVKQEEDGPTLFDARQTVFNGYENLKWVDWTGSVPSDAVYAYISHTNRNDYVCSVSNCATGFYNSGKGPYCYYSNAGQAFYSSTFKILVNVENFEVIQWQRHTSGSIPANAVQRCQGIYAGKNEYGLGKVITSSEVLSIPYNGIEYFYDTYEVLRLYPDYHSQTVTSMAYDTARMSYDQDLTIVLASKMVTNRACSTLSTTVSLIETTQITKYWDIGRPTNKNVKTSLSGTMPVFSGSSIGSTNIPNFEWREGFPYIQSKQHSYSLSITVPPNYECEVVLQGRNLHVRMPLTGYLSRSYNNGQTRRASFQGTFYNLQTDDVVIYAMPCRRLINVPPCY
ncbi:natterin-4-like [Mantella aurantiaca]